MKMVYKFLILFLLLGGAITVYGEDSYDAEVSEIESKLEHGEFSEAFSLALDLSNRNMSRFEAYFFASISQYKMDNLEVAFLWAEEALERAPSQQRQMVDGLLQTISEKKVYIELVKAADKSLDARLYAKAAREYEKAFRLFPNQGFTGMKAALLWQDRKEYLFAAGLYREIEATMGNIDADLARQASAKLMELQPELEKLYNAAMSAGYEKMKADPKDALCDFAVATSILPERPDPNVRIAEILISDDNLKEAINELIVASSKGLSSDQLLTVSSFKKFYRNELFRQFVADVYGPSSAARLSASTSESGDPSRHSENEIKDEIKRLLSGKWIVRYSRNPASLSRTKYVPKIIKSGERLSLVPRFYSDTVEERMDIDVLSASGDQLFDFSRFNLEFVPVSSSELENIGMSILVSWTMTFKEDLSYLEKCKRRLGSIMLTDGGTGKKYIQYEGVYPPSGTQREVLVLKYDAANKSFNGLLEIGLVEPPHMVDFTEDDCLWCCAIEKVEVEVTLEKEPN